MSDQLGVPREPGEKINGFLDIEEDTKVKTFLQELSEDMPPMHGNEQNVFDDMMIMTRRFTIPEGDFIYRLRARIQHRDRRLSNEHV